jgi:hypothetical protein
MSRRIERTIKNRRLFLMGWGISENACLKEKIFADINDTLQGFNSTGKIDYKTYCELYDELRGFFDRGFDEIKKLNKIEDIFKKQDELKEEKKRDEDKSVKPI